MPEYTVLTDAGDDEMFPTEQSAREYAAEYVENVGGWAKIELWEDSAISSRRVHLATIR